MKDSAVNRTLQFLAWLLGSFLLCSVALAQDKVVYHIDNAEAQATKALRNVRNHLDVAPDTKIIVVSACRRRRLPDGRRQGQEESQHRLCRRWSAR